VSRSQEAVKKSKEQYELALLDINNYNSRYMEVNIQYPSNFVVICCEKFSVADPDPGSGAFFTPGSGIDFFQFPDLGSLPRNVTLISVSLVTIFWVKITTMLCHLAQFFSIGCQFINKIIFQF
jgi:hypothetical protein